MRFRRAYIGGKLSLERKIKGAVSEFEKSRLGRDLISRSP